jgi:hypothetical protein
VFLTGLLERAGRLPDRLMLTPCYLDGFKHAAARMRGFHAGAPGPGGVLDEPAAVKALVTQVRRAVHSGAVPEPEALARSGLDRAALLG